MTVLDQQPTKIGQRVEEIFSNTRGWVRDLGERDGEKVAQVEWDEPNDLDGDVFPVVALRVVQVIQVDADWYEDPAMHPIVEVSYTPAGGETNYVVKGGHTLRGIDQIRLYLLGYHLTPNRR